ncbi:MAG: MOSC domain-containing protein, partial [Chloroflexi bacterium]|nr:MOSC domain-containing protein [Chloroflexota bacterium]
RQMCIIDMSRNTALRCAPDCKYSDKAACCYPFEHYAFWERALGRSLVVPSFGENLTTDGLLESEVCLGDVFAVGSAVLQVSQPRQPCFKVALFHGVREFPRWIQQHGRTGFYLRCVQAGEIVPGAELRLLERPYPWATIAEANRLMHRDKQDYPSLARFLELPVLSASWRKTFQARLAGQLEDTRPRLEGPLAD